MNPDAAVLEARGIKKSFFKDKIEIPVLKGVDAVIREGETIAITGSSGAGKSTLLHILGTLEAPTAGTVYFGAERTDLLKYSDRAISDFRNKALGFVFQFHYLLPEFSALENVMLPALIGGAPKAEARERALELLKFVGLSERAKHRPSELSGGEQQRAAVARAVILKPRVILADELTGNLDSENEDRVINLLLELNRATGVALVLVTHDMAVAGKMRRVLQMRDGRLVE